MCRIIGFVSVDDFYEKSKVVFQISKYLSNEGSRVCLFDSYFGMNKLSVLADDNKGVDLKEYITGRVGTLGVLNKINSSLFYVKTNNLSFDYNSHINLIQFFISEISEKFDYILIDIGCNNMGNNSIFNVLSEIIILVSDEEVVIRNTSKMITYLKQFSNIYDFKMVLNNARIFMAHKNKCLRYNDISLILKVETLYVIPKFFNLKKLRWKKENSIKILSKKLIAGELFNKEFYKHNLNFINKLRYYKYE